MPLDLDNLDDAEQFQKHFVAPMVDAVRAELRPLVDRVTTLEQNQPKLDQRVATLESYAKKLGTVYSGIIAVVTYLAHYAWAKVQHKFFS